MSSSIAPSTLIPSAQVIADGIPRFQIPAVPDDPEWDAAAAIEAVGGVDPEIRAFLDAQLETGDVFLDLAPGYGFVALSATTATGGLPTVMVSGLTEARLQALQDAAVDVGGWLESFDGSPDDDWSAQLDARLDGNGRLFVQLTAAQVPDVTGKLNSLISSGRVLALCIPDAASCSEWLAVSDALACAEMTACAMVEQGGEAVLRIVSGTPSMPVIALPSEVAAHATIATGEAEHVADTAYLADSACTVNLASHTELPVARASAPEYALDQFSDIAPGAMTEPVDDIFPTLAARSVVSSSRWHAMRDGLSLISSHSRTGYGVTGAHLLRALQQRGVPVSFFPMGPVDRTIADNPQLANAIESQGAFRADAPSVRLAQQFDLAMHVGRGPRVGFTIFERDTFTPREQHHLRSQDAILVCSAWARNVCSQNGIDDRRVHIVPLGVDRAVFHAAVTPTRRWSETTFLQVGKLEVRKGQLELLRAFEDAFSPKDRVRLVLACGNPFITRAELDALLKPFRKSPMASKITLITTELSTQSNVAQLMAAADCGVFAARAEGWNLEALEMLAMGKQVIATNVTAHTEYLTAENARLVQVDRLEVAFGGGAALTGRWAAWDAVQHEQLVAHLRGVHVDRERNALVKNDAGIATSERYSWDASAEALLAALDRIA